MIRTAPFHVEIPKVDNAASKTIAEEFGIIQQQGGLQHSVAMATKASTRH